MRKLLSFLLILFAGITVIFAQPLKMSYQTVVRNANNELVVNQPVGLQVYIFEDNANGPLVYSETHTASTNANGLVSIVIGTGFHTYTTSLSDVQWAAHDHYLRVDIDPAGGINYSITGTQQLMTVPYAFYSESARYVDTAKYAATALHADTAYYLANFQNSDTSLFAYNSDTATFASNANNAATANYATSAGTAATATNATYADSANVANYAYNANNAVNAQHSDTALYAYDATNAATANYATSAGTANMSNYADSSDFNHLANRPLGTNMGDILYWDTVTTTWHILPVGNIGEVLTLDSNYVPHWNTGGSGNHVLLPTVQTDSVINITGITATAIGTVTNDGGSPLVFGGICWSTQQNPSLSDNYLSSGIGVNSYTSNLTGLAPNQTYYVRAFATNNAGTIYGNELTFTTPITLPSVTTEKVVATSGTTATSGGNVTSDGGDSVSARGVCWSISSNPTISSAHTVDGSGIGAFISAIIGLNQAQTYYVRAYATNTLGTAYGEEITYTSPTVPTVVTDSVISATTATANVANNITDDGGNPPSVRGLCWSLTNNSPSLSDNYTTDGSGTGVYTSTLTGLSPNTVYFIRAYATNIAGTAYDDNEYWIDIYDDNMGYYYEVWGYGSMFLTAPLATSYNTQACPGIPTVTDNDGNIYNTIQIGSQCWMKENLRVTVYGTNNPIQLGTTTSTTVPYRYYPNNDSSTITLYGYLYNGAAALLSDICPSGWHVPTDAEWTTLTSYVSSQNQYGFYIGTSTYSLITKALSSTIGWMTYIYSLGPGNNQSINNLTGFSAMPAGQYYAYNNTASNFGYSAYFWSSTYNSYSQYARMIYNSNLTVYRGNYSRDGSGGSIRCLKD